MKHILTTFIILLASQSIFAQFGINILTAPNAIADLKEPDPQLPIMIDAGTEFQIGIDYWFRHKRKRIEFHPEIYYGQSSKNDFKITAYGFRFQTNVYPFDFPEDCDCPTFGKENDFFQAGFFLSIAPGIRAQSWDNGSFPDNTAIQEADAVIPTFMIGAGLDIGISNLLTLTPVIQYEFSGNYDVGISPDHILLVLNQKQKLDRLHIGARIGIRLDKKNYNLKYKRKYKGKRKPKRKRRK